MIRSNLLVSKIQRKTPYLTLRTAQDRIFFLACGSLFSVLAEVVW